MRTRIDIEYGDQCEEKREYCSDGRRNVCFFSLTSRDIFVHLSNLLGTEICVRLMEGLHENAGPGGQHMNSQLGVRTSYGEEQRSKKG